MRRISWMVALTAAAAVLSGCADDARPARRAAPSVGVSVSACGAGWRATAAGPQHLVLHNTDSRPGEVQLVGGADGAVYADVEPLGPGTSIPLDVRLSAGTYRLRCLMEDEAAVTGPAVVLRGRATDPAPGVRPVSQADLVAPTQAYQHYVRTQIVPLAAEVDRMRRDIGRDRRSAARRSWLRAHLAYERLGAAYDAFGDLDPAVNGLPDGLPGGRHDPDWTGFHRVELGLWHGEPRGTLLQAVSTLRDDVRRLSRHFTQAQIDPLTLAIRAHEITENTLAFTLTGRDDFGSHSARRTVAADLTGTATVLRILRPVLGSRLRALPRLQRDVRRARTVLHPGPRGPIGAWPRADRERLDAVISDLCERLAPVASILEPRRTS